MTPARSQKDNGSAGLAIQYPPWVTTGGVPGLPLPFALGEIKGKVTILTKSLIAPAQAGPGGILPIPTEYAGVKFRSRLEARWAVYLDLVGIEWQYEKEGYQLPSGWYVPDFWLPRHKKWMAIKYENGFGAAEFLKCRDLCEFTKFDVVMADGDPRPTAFMGFWPGDYKLRSGEVATIAQCGDGLTAVWPRSPRHLTYVTELEFDLWANGKADEQKSMTPYCDQAKAHRFDW